MEYTPAPPALPKIESKSITENRSLENASVLNTAEKKKLTLNILDILINRISSISAEDQIKLTKVKNLLQGYDGQFDNISALSKAELLKKLTETKQQLYGSVVFNLPERLQKSSISAVNNIKPIIADLPLHLANQLFPEPENKFSPYPEDIKNLLQKEKFKELARNTNRDYTTDKYVPPKNASPQYKQKLEQVNQNWEEYNKKQFMDLILAKQIVKESPDGTLLINYPLLEAEIRDRTLGIMFIQKMKQLGLFELARDNYRGGDKAEIMAKLSAYANSKVEDKQEKNRKTILPGTIIESTQSDKDYLMPVDFLERNAFKANNSLGYLIPYKELDNLAKKVGLDSVKTVYSLNEGRGWADNRGWSLKENSFESIVTFNPSLPLQDLQHLFSNENRENLARGNLILKKFEERLAQNPQIQVRSKEWRELLQQTIKDVDDSELNLISFEELQTLTFVQDYIDFLTTIDSNGDFKTHIDPIFRTLCFTIEDEIKWQQGEINNFSDLSGEAQEAFLYTTRQGPEYIQTLNKGLNKFFAKLNTPGSGFSKNYSNGSNMKHFPEKRDNLLILMNEITQENGIGATIELNPNYVAGSTTELSASPIIAILRRPEEIHPAYRGLNGKYSIMKLLRPPVNIIDKNISRLKTIFRAP